MANSVSKTDVPVVTLRTLLSAPGLQNEGVESAGGDIARYNRAVDLLQEETAKSSANVLITVQDRDASMIQSRITEVATAKSRLAAGGVEAQFGEGLTGGDIWRWIRSLFDHIDRSQWHPIVRPADGAIATLADIGSVALVGDWGTNLYGAPVSAASISRTGGYELLLHLGDIYYSGTKTEVKDRFLDVWPATAGKVSRALNGNHEMYSGGFAYFDDIFPRLQQTSSYFAFQNANWLLLGLDTAHTNHALDSQQVGWLRSMMQKAGERKVILFSHHQPFSRLDKQGPNLQTALSDLLQKKRITAWYGMNMTVSSMIGIRRSACSADVSVTAASPRRARTR